MERGRSGGGGEVPIRNTLTHFVRCVSVVEKIREKERDGGRFQCLKLEF